MDACQKSYSEIIKVYCLMFSFDRIHFVSYNIALNTVQYYQSTTFKVAMLHKHYCIPPYLIFLIINKQLQVRY